MADKEKFDFIKYNNEYKTQKYFRPGVLLKREYEPDVRERAAELNMTISEYIQALIKKDLENHVL